MFQTHFSLLLKSYARDKDMLGNGASTVDTARGRRSRVQGKALLSNNVQNYGKGPLSHQRPQSHKPKRAIYVSVPKKAVIGVTNQKEKCDGGGLESFESAPAKRSAYVEPMA